MNRRRLALTLALACALPAACGRKGPPIPPHMVVPESPEQLTVRNAADGFQISFKRPKKYVGGLDLDDLGSFEVFRSCEPDPGFVMIADVPVTDHERLRKQNELTLTDYEPKLGQVCVYRVVAVTLDDYRSVPTDSPPIQREMPPPAPTPGASDAATPAPAQSPPGPTPAR